MKMKFRTMKLGYNLYVRIYRGQLTTPTMEDLAGVLGVSKHATLNELTFPQLQEAMNKYNQWYYCRFKHGKYNMDERGPFPSEAKAIQAAKAEYLGELDI